MTQQQTQPSIPKSHRSRNIIAILIAIVIVGLIIYAIPILTTETVTITGLNIQVQYNGSDSGYFGPTSQSVPITNQPSQMLQVKAGQQFFLSFSFTESALATGTHSINEITVVTQGFTLISVDPALPITFSPASSIRITITFQAPNSNFNGAVTVAFSTS